jgi:AcrR family transcriptional regulator
MSRSDQKAASREAILAAARTVFEGAGYEATTTRLIAAKAGMSTGAIFSHWSGKAAIYAEIYGHPPVTPEQGRALLISAEYVDGEHSCRALYDAIRACRP